MIEIQKKKKRKNEHEKTIEMERLIRNSFPFLLALFVQLHFLWKSKF